MTYASPRDRAVAAALFGAAAATLWVPWVITGFAPAVMMAGATVLVSGLLAAAMAPSLVRSNVETGARGWSGGCSVATYAWLLTSFVAGTVFGLAQAVSLSMPVREAVGQVVGLCLVMLLYGFFLFLLPGLLAGAIAGHLFWRHMQRQAETGDTAVAPASR